MITASQIKTYLTCQRKYELAYLKGLAPLDEPAALSFGRAVHQELAGVDSGNPVARACASGAPKLEVSNQEEVFKKGILEGRIDGLSGEYIVENKTTVDTSDKYINSLLWDFQPKLYLWAYEKRGVIYRLLEKFKARIKKNESPEDFEQRAIDWYMSAEPAHRIYKLHISREDIEKAYREAESIEREIQNKEVFWRNSNACSLMGCAYQSICLDYQDGIPCGFRKKEVQNEELV